jgi:hypothetical protein
MFMNAAPATVDHATEPASRDPERGGLLGLVRKLIDYGRGIVAALQGHDAPIPPPDLARRFGSLSVALIIARITSGLRLAAALEQRLSRPAPRRDQQVQPAERKAPAKKRAKPTPRLPESDKDPLRDLPSAKEIAARIRHRRTGAVIVEICRELGITMQHPLWPEIRDAIRFHGGNLAIMLSDVLRPYDEALERALPPENVPHLDRMMAVYAHPP